MNLREAIDTSLDNPQIIKLQELLACILKRFKSRIGTPEDWQEQKRLFLELAKKYEMTEDLPEVQKVLARFEHNARSAEENFQDIKCVYELWRACSVITGISKF